MIHTRTQHHEAAALLPQAFAWVPIVGTFAAYAWTQLTHKKHNTEDSTHEKDQARHDSN